MKHLSKPTIQTLYGAAALALLLQASAARAQEGQGIEPPADTWRFTAGIGAMSGPKFPGSDSNEVRALPLLGASYGRYFIGAIPGGGGPLGIGAFVYRDSQFRLGVSVGGGIQKERKESDDARLAGLGDVAATARATVFGSYQLGWLSLRGYVSTDVGGHDQGTLASLEAEARYSLMPGLSLTTGPGLTWADHRYTQTFFGIDAAQSAASGRAQYTPGSGISTLRWSVGADIDLAPQWKLGARLTAARLQGDAADSPLAFDKSQNSAGLFLSYRF